MSKLPNIALDDVPVGKDESSNKIIKEFGEIKTFDFKVKSHVEIGEKIKNWILIFLVKYLEVASLF